MPQSRLDALKDPRRDVRYLVWVLVGALALVAIMLTAMSVSSTRWFCAEGCHDVEAASVVSHQASTHSEISCMSCHMEVGTNPLAYWFGKARSLSGLYTTLDESELPPLNPDSEVALNMESSQCNQCHDLSKRTVTPKRGVRIDHEPHDEAGVTCAVCHNRVGHQEDFRLALASDNPNEEFLLHPDFMQMEGCFRCHTQTETLQGGLKAPGECEACHTTDFELKPQSHYKNGFFPKGHAELGQLEASRVASFQIQSSNEGDTEAHQGSENTSPSVGSQLPPVGEVNQCSMCHSEKFCSDCHGLPMPHPVDFAKSHAKLGKSNPKVCSRCHGLAAQFCNECHHGSAMDWKYDTSVAWRNQHPTAVQQVGASACFKCHHPTYCAECHVKGRQ